MALRALIGIGFVIVMLVRLIPLLRGDALGTVDIVLLLISGAGLAAVVFFWRAVIGTSRRR